MEKQYYIVVDDNRVGPLSFDQLRSYTILPATLVWTAGMADWARADSLPEMQPLIFGSVVNEESAFGSYAQPEEAERPWTRGQSAAYGSAGQNPFERAKHTFDPPRPDGQFQVKTNWKTLSIVATVVGFIFSCIGGIVGIFAILEANKAENAANMGNGFQTLSYWSNCKTLTIISFILSGLGLVANLYVLKMFPTRLFMF